VLRASEREREGEKLAMSFYEIKIEGVVSCERKCSSVIEISR
jgi:hypothetical protein